MLYTQIRKTTWLFGDGSDRFFMNSETVIQVNQIGKQYNLHKKPNQRLAELFTWRKSKKIVPHIDNPLFWALKDVCFEVQKGEVIGIIGKNGAGKSTLLKILSKITSPTLGSVKIKGKIGSLLEVGTGFHPELSGRENIFLNGAILGMRRQEIKAKLDEIITFAGVEAFADEPVKHYSSGMYTRLAFAVAAHLETDILIVDEVLAVGDFEFQKKCLGKMQEVSTQEGKTVLFVSHNLTAIQSLCKEVILLKQGELILKGEKDEVIANYIKINSDVVLSQNWIDADVAPGNTFVKIQNVQLIPTLKTPQSLIDVQTPIKITFNFWNLRDNMILNISLHLFDIYGLCIFNVSTEAINCDIGLYTSECYIPPNLLNDGIYYISIMIVKDTSVCLFNFESCLRFEVKDVRPASSAWYGKWIGAVRPNLPFSFSKRN